VIQKIAMEAMGRVDPFDQPTWVME
jgi:hypothetical protein